MLSVLLATAFGSTPTGFDYDAWERVLDKHVKPGAILGARTNVVNYFGIRDDPEFAHVVDSLAKADLSDPSWNESLALGCNAYTISVVNAYIKQSCRYADDGRCLGPNYGARGIGFGFKNNTVGGHDFTIDEIEGLLVDPKLGTTQQPLFSEANAGKPTDIRIHACMTCGGISCPDLRFYRDTTIDEDLAYAATQWMANPYKGNRVDKSTNTVYFSHIMSWYNKKAGGFADHGGVLKAFGEYFSKPMKDFLESSNGEYNVKYLNYIWDANGPVPCDCYPALDDPDAFNRNITQAPIGLDVLGDAIPACHVFPENIE